MYFEPLPSQIEPQPIDLRFTNHKGNDPEVNIPFGYYLKTRSPWNDSWSAFVAIESEAQRRKK